MFSPVNLGKASPANYEGLVALDATAHAGAVEAGLDPLLIELVKIRASQINGCAFCLRLHSRDALAKGESPDRLAVLPAWWESQYFNEQEQAALALAEGLTTISAGRNDAHGTVDADATLTPAQIAAVSWLVIVINAWNRVAIASHYPVAPPSRPQGI
ncbi:carboxymuconolactone decarboxylase family protein [Galactobacter caseinivorans]|uniref:Carboxymuconolactone decarboxylase family protein n=2 Tax=Galactobacter caseinivorans TaxID=2676123 RepID=A0A496PN71_9MICC|nr:carboxymuconolactone decarboxylase family protein [Galactobacter caseinivorans]